MEDIQTIGGQIERLKGIKEKFQTINLANWIPIPNDEQFQKYTSYGDFLTTECGVDMSTISKELQDALSVVWGDWSQTEKGRTSADLREVCKNSTLADIQAFASINIPAPGTANLKSLGEIKLSTNGQTSYTFDSNDYDGFDNFTIDVNVPTPTLTTVRVHHLCVLDSTGIGPNDGSTASGYMNNNQLGFVSEYNMSDVGPSVDIDIRNIHPTPGHNNWALFNDNCNTVRKDSDDDKYINSINMTPVLYCHISEPVDWSEVSWNEIPDGVESYDAGDIYVLWSWSQSAAS